MLIYQRVYNHFWTRPKWNYRLPWHVLKHSCMADANQRSRSRKVWSLTHPKWALSACLRVVLSSVKRTCLIMFWENGNRNAHSWSESCWLGIYSIYVIYCYNMCIYIYMYNLFSPFGLTLMEVGFKDCRHPKILLDPSFDLSLLTLSIHGLRPSKKRDWKGCYVFVILKKVGKV